MCPGVSVITHKTQRAEDLQDCFDGAIDALTPDISVPDGEEGSFFMLLKNRMEVREFCFLRRFPMGNFIYWLMDASLAFEKAERSRGWGRSVILSETSAEKNWCSPKRKGESPCGAGSLYLPKMLR